MIEKNIPKVVFIGAKKVGKTSAMNAIWGRKEEKFLVSEFIEGRGDIEYCVQRLPYIPFALNEEVEQWLSNSTTLATLSEADVIVLLFEYGDIQYNKKINILRQIIEKCHTKLDVSFVIGLNKVEYCIQEQGDNGEYLVPISLCSELLEYTQGCYEIFNRCVKNSDGVVVPFASHEIIWNVNKLKSTILENIISKHNDSVFDSNCPTVVFVGKTGCGKSSTINTICGTSLPVDGSVACTKYPIVINKLISFPGEVIRVNIVDLPGIAESLEADILYEGYYNQYIKNASAIVCLSQANTRAYTQDEIFFKKLYENNILNEKSKIILAINKIDLLFKTYQNPNGIDLSTISDDDSLIKEKIQDYFDNVFSKIFDFLQKIDINSVVVFSNSQSWNINKLINKIYQLIKS